MHTVLLIAALLSASLPAQADPPAAFECCDDAGIARVLNDYLRLHGALHEGESQARVSGRYYALRSSLSRIRDRAGADGALIRSMFDIVDSAKGANLDGLHSGFTALSSSMIALALRHEGGAQVVAEARCGTTEAWLQANLAEPQAPSGRECGEWR
ncbi:MAG: hypothetical protein ACI8PZ_000667 [Myxococcota bacterium]|jgi:hypothetical protein